MLRGFVKLKNPKIQKNSEVRGWAKLQLGFVCFLKIVCFFVLFFAVRVSKKKMDRGWVGEVWPIRVFHGLFDFF